MASLMEKFLEIDIRQVNESRARLEPMLKEGVIGFCSANIIQSVTFNEWENGKMETLKSKLSNMLHGLEFSIKVVSQPLIDPMGSPYLYK